MKLPEDGGKWIESIVCGFIEESPENTLKNRENDKAFDTPLVGFSNGADPLFDKYRENVGPFHLTPSELFSKTFPGVRFEPEELTVISWILPHIEKTKSDNRKQAEFPSERWARGRVFGEEVNSKLRKHVSDTLNENGFETVAPLLSPHWEKKISDKYGYASTWSERHAAYASGLGTFGLCDGLITPKGKAMRTGSVISRIRISPTERKYDNHNAWCLFYAKGTCKKCAKRCPANAISESGHDKVKCREYIRSAVCDHIKTEYGFEATGCGLCQTGVPCESKIPINAD